MKRVVERKSPHNIGNHSEKIQKRRSVQSARRASRSVVKNSGRSRHNKVINRDHF